MGNRAGSSFSRARLDSEGGSAVAQPLAQVFEWTELRSYLDPDNAMVRDRHPMQVQLYQIEGLQPGWAERCP